MKLMSLEMRKRARLEKRSRNSLESKRLENKLLLEIKAPLDEHLMENDSVMIEVKPDVVGEFLNVATNNLGSLYDFEAYDGNKFIFSNRDLIL